MKKLVALFVSLVILIGLFAIPGVAVPDVHHHVEGDCEAELGAGITRAADICPRPNCQAKAFVWRCGGEMYVDDVGTCPWSSSCTVQYCTSTTKQVCNACGFELRFDLHPICDEIHSSCGRGIYPTCTIRYY